MNQHIHEWQRRPRTVDDRFVRPEQTHSYYQDMHTERRNGWATAAFGIGALGAHTVLAWSQWAAHETCVHGNEHSVVAAIISGALSSASLGGAVAGFMSDHPAGSRVGWVMLPTSLVLAGFGVLMWSPSWPAALAATLMHAALVAIEAAVRVAWNRWWRRMLHEAGMQNEVLNAGLEKTRMETNAQMGVAAIVYQRDVDVARELRTGDVLRQHEMHERYPETFSAPRVVTADGRIVTVTPEQLAQPQPLAMAAGAEQLSITPRIPDDDWMDLARTVPGVVQEAWR